MKGRNVFLLDLISNSLGAVLLIFLLLISRHFDRPPTRIDDTLFIAAASAREQAEIAIWVQPPGADAPVWYGKDIAGLQWSEAAGAWRPARVAVDDMSMTDFLGSAKYLAAVGGGGAAVAIPKPAVGCWRFGAWYEDNTQLLTPAPVEAEITLDVWLDGPMRPKEGSKAYRTTQFSAPTSDSRHCIAIAGDGAPGEATCCQQP